ncbi:MAG: ECF transporter S component [Clostridia bacterium]|nr:ECF transporter S component [Clostridia bacterium]
MIPVRRDPVMRLVMTSLWAALCCVATLAIQIPSPMNGYVNLGDGLVLLSGWLLGPLHGFAAAGLGSALADLITGYTVYAPATFLIKGLMALMACLLKPRWLGGLVAEGWMVLGYFLFAGLLMGEGWAAAASIPGNLAQGAVGLGVALTLEKALGRVNWRKMMSE